MRELEGDNAMAYLPYKNTKIDEISIKYSQEKVGNFFRIATGRGLYKFYNLNYVADYVELQIWPVPGQNSGSYLTYKGRYPIFRPISASAINSGEQFDANEVNGISFKETSGWLSNLTQIVIIDSMRNVRYVSIGQNGSAAYARIGALQVTTLPT